jgi:hypothetical protein
MVSSLKILPSFSPGKFISPKTPDILYNNRMPTRTAALSLIALLLLTSCSVFNRTTPTPVPDAITDPATYYGELSSFPGGEFTLVLPTGQTAILKITTCKGVRSSEPLNLVAENTPDKLNPNRIEVQITGVHKSNGEAEPLYLAVIMGATDKWSFMGSLIDAPIFLDGAGSGVFNNVSIPDTHVITYDFEPFPESVFSGAWTCTP